MSGGKGALKAGNLAPRPLEVRPTRRNPSLLFRQLCREHVAFGLKTLYHARCALPLLINLEQGPLLGRLRALLGSRQCIADDPQIGRERGAGLRGRGLRRFEGLGQALVFLLGGLPIPVKLIETIREFSKIGGQLSRGGLAPSGPFRCPQCC